MLPIVHPGPLEVAVVEEEAERTHEPQLGPDRHATAADVPAVLRDVGLIEDDVEHEEQGTGNGE
jgi:hypothetical protein